MSCGKRLAKRSILGTRVCAPLDKHYYSGIIKATKTSNVDTRDTLYSVLFDNVFNGKKVTLDYSAQQLIGPGFQSVSIANLNKGQKIYLTYNGREVSGSVDCHDLSKDEVFLTIDNTSTNSNQNSLINQSSIKVKRRLDEIRLLESRKSARLQEIDTDYSKVAEGQTDPIRRRTSSMSSSVSNSSMSSHIDVPIVQNGRKRRPSNSEDDVMDDCMAAMVLMSLSCSPKSPRLPELIIYKCTWPGCLYQSEHCQQIEKHVRTQHLGRTDLNGESSDREEEFYYTEIEVDENSVGSSSSNSSSSHSVPQSPSISNDGSLTSGNSHSPTPSPQTHIFFAQSCSAPTFSHLEDHEYERRRQNSNSDLENKFNNDINCINNGLNAFNGFNVNNNSVSNNKITNNCINNNINNNSINFRGKQKSLLSTPINIPGITGLPSYRAHTYATSAPPVSLQSPRVNHKYMRLNSNNNRVSNGNNGHSLGTSIGTAIGTTILQSSNKNSPSKRGRGESRKCRKVYGMDNRESWCTQCKWKKACTRFTD